MQFSHIESPNFADFYFEFCLFSINGNSNVHIASCSRVAVKCNGISPTNKYLTLFSFNNFKNSLKSDDSRIVPIGGLP